MLFRSVLNRIVKELNVQFNTRKQLLLKTLYAYIANSSALDDLDCFSMFGTNSFNLVWEKVCAEVMDNLAQEKEPLKVCPFRFIMDSVEMERNEIGKEMNRT